MHTRFSDALESSILAALEGRDYLQDGLASALDSAGGAPAIRHEHAGEFLDHLHGQLSSLLPHELADMWAAEGYPEARDFVPEDSWTPASDAIVRGVYEHVIRTCDDDDMLLLLIEAAGEGRHYSTDDLMLDLVREALGDCRPYDRARFGVTDVWLSMNTAGRVTMDLPVMLIGDPGDPASFHQASALVELPVVDLVALMRRSGTADRDDYVARIRALLEEETSLGQEEIS